jgi:alpha-ribazole phosphatase
MIGASNPPLDPVGCAQAQALPGRVARWTPGRFFASPMTRCRETVRALSPEQAVAFDDDLREIDFGQWENRSFDELAAERSDLVEKWKARAPDFAFPGGESLAGFLDRVHRAADRLAREDAETVLAVTHGGVIRAKLCHFLGLEPWRHVLFDLGYAALAVIRLFGEKGVLVALDSPEIAC